MQWECFIQSRFFYWFSTQYVDKLVLSKLTKYTLALLIIGGIGFLMAFYVLVPIQFQEDTVLIRLNSHQDPILLRLVPCLLQFI